MSIGYSDDELVALRGCLASLRSLSLAQRQGIASAVESGECPAHLAPFHPLLYEAPLLVGRLAGDPLLRQYGIWALFPGVYESIYRDGKRPAMLLDGRTRGQVAIFEYGEGKGLVVKPWQSGREAEIAQMAASAGVGPAQLPAPEGFLVEEFVPGVFFTDLPRPAPGDGTLYAIGLRLGEMLAALHSRGICYNDATLSDPEGRSHLLVSHGKQDGGGAPDCCLIDFGVSVLLDKFPDLEMEEVYNLVRTTPEFRLLSHMGMGGQDMGRFLAQYRQKLAASSPEEIMARDRVITEQGLRLVASRLGNEAVSALKDGFDSGYKQSRPGSSPVDAE